MQELLTPSQMAVADRTAIESGTPGIDLMEAAGQVLFETVEKHFSKALRILVVCGPGNNGGDGYVVAGLLHQQNRQVAVYSPLGTEKLSGDAKLAFQRLPGDIKQVENPDYDSADLIIDALFGAGLSKDITGKLAKVIEQINDAPADVLAVDLPSGINGETGAVCGIAIEATVSATFFRYKPGHFLFPGRQHCGCLEVGQIGIEDSVLPMIGVQTFRNGTSLWRNCFPSQSATQHKYSRGHTLAVSGDLMMSGAARLMASAALRIGSGLVTLSSSREILPINASRLDSILFHAAETPAELVTMLNDPRVTSVCLGPGMVPDEATRKWVKTVLKSNGNVVLDAGALSAFDDRCDQLAEHIAERNGESVITPHMGEFGRLFPDLTDLPSKLDMARSAARQLNAVVILKGPDTVIAAPDGEATINDNAPQWLATAGSGDVLAGIVAGLLAQSMPAYFAACAAVWIHGQAANILGPGLIAGDLDQGIKSVIQTLQKNQKVTFRSSQAQK